jgi:hemerythrin-like domain-containing protein
MKKPGPKNNFTEQNYFLSPQDRRGFLGNVLIGAGLITLPNLMQGCKNEEEEEVTPTEDLMREHGVLNRILLVYQHYSDLYSANKTENPGLLHKSAGIVKKFIEDYHEKQEETYLFSRFEKANTLTDLVKTLRVQHLKGRQITAQILQITQAATLEKEIEQLRKLLSDFTAMYRPHEAREDTVLFPAFKKIVSIHEYDSLGEEFEKNEHKLFGEDGFQTILNEVESIERSLGIHDLAKFTPA